jgi:hypothetical protein
VILKEQVMKHSSLLMSVLGSSLVMGGAMFTAPRVAHSAGAWYLAGQVKMALGDTDGGLQLMSRAARQREQEQNVAAPKAKPSSSVQAKACPGSSALTPAKTSPKKEIQNAQVTDPQVNVQPAGFSFDTRTEPKVLMASAKFPPLPFEARELPGLTREQVQQMNETLRASERGWIESQRLINSERMAALRAAAQKHQVVRVVVNSHDAPDAPEAPQVTP